MKMKPMLSDETEARIPGVSFAAVSESETEPRRRARSATGVFYANSKRDGLRSL